MCVCMYKATKPENGIIKISAYCSSISDTGIL